MASGGKFLCSEIVVGKKILEQISHFAFPDTDISYEYNDDKDNIN